MPLTPAFKRIFEQLNSAQQLAVTTIEGPVMVLAGPGTGKTQVLAARVANILLTTDTNPSSILALTFTESAAKNMRERLVRMIGKTGFYVQIQTFHAFCSDVINSHPEFFSIDRESQALTELERYDILQNSIDTLPLTALKPLNTPYFYLKDMISALSNLKREGVTVSEFELIVTAEQTLLEQELDELAKAEAQQRQKMVAKNTELLEVYRQYQLALSEHKRFDFDDMISLVVAAFETESELLVEYQERLQYFLVDEYQDTNSAQNQVIDLVASYWGEAANLFVVGDPNQAIYRFQGASLENVLGFTQRYPKATIITLDQGYRSSQKLYDAAAGLIAENQVGDVVQPLAIAQKLQSQKGIGQPLSLFVAPSQTLETVYIACQVQALLEQGVLAEEIAVLYRNNADAVEMAEALERWGIPYDLERGSNVLEAEHIRQFICLLQVISAIKNGSEDEVLYEVMQYQWLCLPSLVVMKAARVAHRAKCSLYELIAQGFTFLAEHDTQTLTAAEFEFLAVFMTRIQNWIAAEAQLSFPAWFELVLTESGFLPWVLLQPTKVTLLNGVNSLFREVKAMTVARRGLQLNEFLEVIKTLEAHHLSITLEDLNISTAAVRLSTVHKAKGQEWEYVFILRAIDGKWGNGRNRELIPLPAGILKNTDHSQKERNSDDRRLFYVAMTRAKEKLTITYPETIILENRTKQVLGSVFLEELKDHLVVDVSEVAQRVVSEAETHLARLLQPVVPKVVGEEEKIFFTDILKNFSLSVSALNTYLHSPSEFVTKYLLKVPVATTPHMAFGTAVHKTLEEWFKQWQSRGQKLPLEAFLKLFEAALVKEPLVQEDFAARLARGQEVLTQYFDKLSVLEKPALFIERFFGGSWNQVLLDDIPLTGRIDRVDWVDAEQTMVAVVDYKTGKPRTVGEIEATTASAELSERERSLPVTIRGKYKRQLIFYTVLAELDPSFKPKVVETIFEFIEPDKQSGKQISRRFSITKEEVSDLKNLIRTVMAELRSLVFIANL